MILIFLASVIIGVTSNQLGLAKAVGKVVGKILSCYKCTTFWISMGLCYYNNVCLLCSFVISLASAFASMWFALLMDYLIKNYNSLWEKIHNQSNNQ